MNNIAIAVDRYAVHCAKNGLLFQQPCSNASEEIKGIVYLRNQNGNLARYSVKRDKILA